MAEPGLKVGVAAVIGALGVIDLGWSTHALLILLLAGLAVPMAYGAIVWFSIRLPQRVAGPPR